MEGYPSQQDPFQGGACTLSQGSLSGPDEGDLVGVHHVMGTIFQHEAHPGDPVSRHQPLLTGISESLAMTAPSHQQESGAPALSSLWHLSLILFTNKNLRTRKNVLRICLFKGFCGRTPKECSVWKELLPGEQDLFKTMVFSGFGKNLLSVASWKNERITVGYYRNSKMLVG